jgi:hypothetical protein
MYRFHLTYIRPTRNLHFYLLFHTTSAKEMAFNILGLMHFDSNLKKNELHRWDVWSSLIGDRWWL